MDKGSGQPVTIAVIKNVGKDGNITPGKLYVKPRKNDGSFKLSGDNPGDVEIYYVLELLSQNKSNPFATPGVIKILKELMNWPKPTSAAGYAICCKTVGMPLTGGIKKKRKSGRQLTTYLPN